MQFEVSLNGKRLYVSGVGERGHTGVHLNTSGGENSEATLKSSSYDTTDATETVRRHWPDQLLRAGDEVLIRCVVEQTPTTPVSEKRSSTDERICITNRDLANKVAQMLESVDTTLMELIEAVTAVEDPSNVKKFKNAIGSVIWEIGEKVLAPLHNEFPDLRPDTLRDTPL